MSDGLRRLALFAPPALVAIFELLHPVVLLGPLGALCFLAAAALIEIERGRVPSHATERAN